MSSGKPTIDDVAALAGVARVTVSRVLNGGPNVSAKARKAVLAAVDKLQFKVNMQARFLAGGKSHTVGLLYSSDLESEPNSFYYAGLELGALRACSKAGFQLSMHAVNQHSLRKNDMILELVASRRYEGLILTPPFSDDIGLLQAISEQNFPVVAVSAGYDAQKLVPAVGIDDEAAGYEITRHLISLGHRKFAFIKGLEGHVSAEDRYFGYVRALREAGLEASDMPTVRGNFTFKSGTDMANQLLGGEVFTALVCANDDMAVGAMFAAHRAGLALPQDVSIVGFDDTPVSEIIWPPLTTVHQPLKAMGQQAAEILFERISGERMHGGGKPVSHIVPHTLVFRESAVSPRHLQLKARS
ncbi:LacI family transcriptional regulator [Asticcacaulis sp. AC460]|uniref:LacI family DNA-binding transcriptional regulator n=1 Tax=Asticcacaulis sp. AC460 TaxID=1282360 RepID=UPI0003C3F795|nr:LacI family DNA-binding transcriptional regulator [Asticcacaulis sp. AC460]ESQ88960.1 LacI family transcriptional regulator [Asticcacaulis sp. AC460]